MGHYDEQYESEYDRRNEERTEELLRWIKKKIKKMDRWQLETVWQVVDNLKSYEHFFGMIRNIAKGGIK